VLSVKRSEGPALTFLGFRDKDVEALRSLTNLPIADEPLATTCGGRVCVVGGRGSAGR